jgi:hypothetical protein
MILPYKPRNADQTILNIVRSFRAREDCPGRYPQIAFGVVTGRTVGAVLLPDAFPCVSSFTVSVKSANGTLCDSRNAVPVKKLRRHISRVLKARSVFSFLGK